MPPGWDSVKDIYNLVRDVKSSEHMSFYCSVFLVPPVALCDCESEHLVLYSKSQEKCFLRVHLLATLYCVHYTQYCMRKSLRHFNN